MIGTYYCVVKFGESGGPGECGVREGLEIFSCWFRGGMIMACSVLLRLDTTGAARNTSCENTRARIMTAEMVIPNIRGRYLDTVGYSLIVNWNFCLRLWSRDCKYKCLVSSQTPDPNP